jgi:TRAP transporter TAXI family solute receptor
MRHVLKDLKILLLANLWIVPVVAALVAALFYFVAPPPPMSATMATGPEGGGYRVFAERLKEQLAKEGFQLTLVPSAGSRENLERLLADEPEVQIALVQSGLEQQLKRLDRTRLQSLGAVYQEPLWLFHRKDIGIEQLSDLLPLRLGLGNPGSGTHAATAAIFAATAITAQQYPASWISLGGSKAAAALTSGTLDAAFFVGPAENARIQQLAAHPELSLASLHRAAAYEARLPFLKRVTVSEGLLDLTHNAPPQDVITLSPVATLVINQAFHPGLAPLILEATREVTKNGTLLDPAGAYPSAQPRTFELSSDAEHYYQNGLPLLQRYLPFRIAALADRYIILLIPLLMILIPLFKAVGPLYRWRIRARIYHWYKYLREIDRQLDAGTLPERLDAEVERLERLQDKLAKVEVPLSYSNELYDLHMHLRYVIERLQTLQRRRATQDQQVG